MDSNTSLFCSTSLAGRIEHAEAQQQPPPPALVPLETIPAPWMVLFAVKLNLPLAARLSITDVPSYTPANAGRDDCE